MKEQEILDGNKIILQYEGVRPEIKHKGVLPKYHESWDRLMPVVLKIIFECSSNCYFWANGYLANSNGKYGFAMLDDQTNGTEATHETPILAVWQCVVNYLKNK
jgi:hypothetical protein